MALAFAPYGAAYAALPALMFQYWAWSRLSARRAAVIGFCFGLGLYGAGIWWVYISLHDYGGANPAAAALLTLLPIGLWALFPALCAWLAAKAPRWPGALPRIAAAALLWTGLEYVRGNWLLNGFPWLLVGYSQLSTPLAGYAPVAGVHGVGFLLTVTAFCLAETFASGMRVKSALLLLAPIWVGGGLLREVQWTQIAGDPLRITLVQGNISQDLKWLTDQRPRTLSLYRSMTERHWSSDVIIWPETAIPAFLSEVREAYLDPLAAEARRHHADLVVSVPIAGEGRTYFNSVLAFDEIPSVYHKIHLLPFGEYLPLQPLSGWILDLLRIPLGDFTAGADRQPLPTAGGYPFVATICYEDVFGGEVIRQIADAAYIVNVSNDAWFGDSPEPYQHMQMARMRALETGRWLARAANTGLTGFIGPDGKIVSLAPIFTTTTLTADIVPMSGVTPYVRHGDSGVFAVLAVLTGMLCLAAWLKTKPASGNAGGWRWRMLGR